MEDQAVSETTQESVPMAEPEQIEQIEQNEPVEQNNDQLTPGQPKEILRESNKSIKRHSLKKDSTNSKSETNKKESADKVEKSESFFAIDPLEKIESPDLSPSIAEEQKKLLDPFPHRHYITFHPCVNKLLDMKWDQNLRTMHLKKLKGIKSNIDNKPPKQLPHLEHKLKKIQMENEAHDPDIHQTKYPQICTNATVRAREQTRISIENKKMLHRLETKQPHISHRELDVDRYKSLAYLENISGFPQKYIEQRQEYSERIKQKKPKVAAVNPVLRKTFLNTIDTNKYLRRFEKKVLPEIRPRTSNVVERTMMDALSDASDDKPIEQDTEAPTEAIQEA
ncbi:hypothetical protein HK103_002358 [Boothiomyces macroporosus]|uniref:Uncharacterized protein n=1 Tax=Boothiomyces macroporosus TaxID=261099 RepID=A0AAD5UJD1_9FUNG|nr:hypothetical protein HK103_002358 [Boothiomyces macroporosus]